MNNPISFQPSIIGGNALLLDDFLGNLDEQEVRYDSVSDNTTMYVVYNNHKAYPMYNVVYNKT